MEFKTQICTTREQSKRLLAMGLKKETADMYYEEDGTNAIAGEGYEDMPFLPAWSLHRLFFLLPDWIAFDLLDYIDVYEEYIEIIERSIHNGIFNKQYINSCT